MYDTNINEKIKNLEEILRDKVPQTKFRFLSATYWDDGDYELRLCTSWGDSRHKAIYSKSRDKYYFHTEKRKIPYDEEIDIKPKSNVPKEMTKKWIPTDDEIKQYQQSRKIDDGTFYEKPKVKCDGCKRLVSDVYPYMEGEGGLYCRECVNKHDKQMRIIEKIRD